MTLSLVEVVHSARLPSLKTGRQQLFCTLILRYFFGVFTLALFASCLPLLAHAEGNLHFYNTPVHLFTQHGQIDLKSNIYFYEDKSNKLQLEDVTKPELQKQFKLLKPSYESFSHTSSAYWLRFHLTNMETVPVKWYFSINYPLLDEVTFYLMRSKGEKRYETGDMIDFNNRPIDLPNFVFPLSFNPVESSTVLIRVVSQGSLNVPMTITTEQKFVEKSSHQALYHGIYYGALIILTLYNLLVFSATRIKSYFLNAYYMAALFLFMITMSGHAYQYLWPTAPIWANISLPVFIANATLAIVLFGKSFLYTEEHTKKYKNYYSFFIATAILALLLALTLPYVYAIKINTALGLATIIFIYILCIVRFREGYRAAKSFILAWSVFFVSTMIYALGAFAIIPDYYANEIVILTGTAAQIIFINFALAQHTRDMSAQILNFEKDAKELLQKEVAERTSELTKANQQLADLNTKLEQLSIKDDLTQVANRRYFNHMLEQAYASARRNHTNLSLLFLDIDHFKQLNDSLGHQAGDDCLIFVASLINKSLHRPSDFLARYGGEEFAIILPDTDVYGAKKIAANIIQTIRTTPFYWRNNELAMTASVGVFSAPPSEDIDIHDFITRADTAMYCAKENGRDRLEVYQ